MQKSLGSGRHIKLKQAEDLAVLGYLSVSRLAAATLSPVKIRYIYTVHSVVSETNVVMVLSESPQWRGADATPAMSNITHDYLHRSL